MRVLFIQDVGDKGGATNSLKELIVNLNKNYNVEPIIITSEKNSINKFADNNTFENYNVNHKQMLVSYNNSSKIKKIIKRVLFPALIIRHKICNHLALKKIESVIDLTSIDIIHTNVNRDDLAILIKKKYNIPHIMHIREFSDIDYKCTPLNRNYIKIYNKYTDRFIAISNVISSHWEKKGIEKSKITVIYNGIEHRNFTTNNKKESKKIKMIFLGKICETKGQIQVIKALSMLDKKILKKIELDFYGHGEQTYINHLKELVEQNNISNVINFNEYSEDINKLLPTYDIGFICSKSEAFGRVTIEYMLSNVAVIASNTGANLELIEDNITGMLYQYNNEEELCKKIKEMIENKDHRTEIILNAHKNAMNNFISDINAQKIYKLYCDTIKNK